MDSGIRPWSELEQSYDGTILLGNGVRQWREYRRKLSFCV